MTLAGWGALGWASEWGLDSGVLPVSGNVSATFGASSSVTLTAFTSGNVSATVAATGAPIGIYPASGVVSATFAGSGAIHQLIVTSGTLTATFAATVATPPALHLFSTQPGNPWIVSVDSYSFQLQHRIWGGVGLPVANLGTDGDYYFRKDGAAGARMYARASGAWTAIN